MQCHSSTRRAQSADLVREEGPHEPPSNDSATEEKHKEKEETLPLLETSPNELSPECEPSWRDPRKAVVKMRWSRVEEAFLLKRVEQEERYSVEKCFLFKSLAVSVGKRERESSG